MLRCGSEHGTEPWLEGKRNANGQDPGLCQRTGPYFCQLTVPWSPQMNRTLVSPSVCPVCPTSPPHWVSLDFPAHIMGARRYFGQKRIDLGVLWPLLLHGLGCCSSEVMETEYPADSSKGTFLSPLLFRWGPQLLRLVGSEQLNWWFMSSGQDGGG